MRGFLALWIGVCRKGPDETHQIPDMLVGFHSSKGRHAAQADAALHNPEKFPVGIPLNFGRSQVGCPGVHPSPCVGGFPSRITMALGTVGAEEFVAFRETRFHIRGRRRGARATGSPNKEMLGFSSEERLCATRLGKCAQVELRSHYAAADKHQDENRDCNPNKALHRRAPKDGQDYCEKQEGRRASRPSLAGIRMRPGCWSRGWSSSPCRKFP